MAPRRGAMTVSDLVLNGPMEESLTPEEKVVFDRALMMLRSNTSSSPSASPNRETSTPGSLTSETVFVSPAAAPETRVTQAMDVDQEQAANSTVPNAHNPTNDVDLVAVMKKVNEASTDALRQAIAETARLQELKQNILELQNSSRRIEDELQKERTLHQQKEAEVAALQQRLLLAEASPLILRRAEKYTELVRPLRPPRSNTNGLPPTADAGKLSHLWASIGDSLSSIIDIAYSQHPYRLNVEIAPSNFANFVVGLFGPQHLDWRSRPEASALSAHVLKGYAAFVLIRETFLSTFPDFERPSSLLQKCREDQALINGPEAVAIYDYMGYKSLAEEAQFTNEHLPSKAADICTKLNASLSRFRTDKDVLPSPVNEQEASYDTTRFTDCAKETLWLKMELLLSKPGYFVLWAQPNDRFDSRYMDAVDDAGPIDTAMLGNLSNGIRVKHCVFPALVQYDMAPPRDIPSALLCNKSFLSQQRQNSGDSIVIGKAVVLIDGVR